MSARPERTRAKFTMKPQLNFEFINGKNEWGNGQAAKILKYPYKVNWEGENLSETIFPN